MRINLAIAVFIFLCGAPRVHADTSFGDHAAASTFKTLAKGFVQTVGLENLKAKHIKSLSKMDDAKFRKRYAKVYDVLKDLPSDLRARYSLTEGLNKTEAIRQIQRINNEELGHIIDAIPDEAIMKQAKYYLGRMAQQVKDQNFLQQINALWNKIIQKS